jgi:hypothetical protein
MTVATSPKTIPPASEQDMTPAEIAAADAAMADVLEREPVLSDNGFKHGDIKEAEFLNWREDIRRPASPAGFMVARGWLKQFGKIKALNKRGSSYGLKHVAARDIGYVTNGVFIAAAIAEGFIVRRAGAFGDSPNAWFNISAKAWRR